MFQIISTTLCLLQIETEQVSEEDARLLLKIVNERTLPRRTFLAITEHIAKFDVLEIAAAETINKRRKLYNDYTRAHAAAYLDKSLRHLEEKASTVEIERETVLLPLSQFEVKFLTSEYMITVFGAVVDPERMDVPTLRKNAGEANAHVMAIIIPDFIKEMRKVNELAFYVVVNICILAGKSFEERDVQLIIQFLASTSVVAAQDWPKVAYEVMCVLNLPKWPQNQGTVLWKIYIPNKLPENNPSIAETYLKIFSELKYPKLTPSQRQYVPHWAKRVASSADEAERKELMDHADEILHAAVNFGESLQAFLRRAHAIDLEPLFRSCVIDRPALYDGYAQLMVTLSGKTAIRLKLQSPEFWMDRFAQLCMGKADEEYLIFRAIVPQLRQRYNDIDGPAADMTAAELATAGITAEALDAQGMSAAALATVGINVATITTSGMTAEHYERLRKLKFFTQMDQGMDYINYLTSPSDDQQYNFAAEQVCALAGIFDSSESQSLVYNGFLDAFIKVVISKKSKKLARFFRSFSFQGVPHESKVYMDIPRVIFGALFGRKLQNKLENPEHMENDQFVKRMLRSLLAIPEENDRFRIKRLMSEFAGCAAGMKIKFAKLNLRIFTEEPIECLRWFISTLVSDSVALHLVECLIQWREKKITEATIIDMLVHVIIEIYNIPAEGNTSELRDDEIKRHLRNAASTIGNINERNTLLSMYSQNN